MEQNRVKPSKCFATGKTRYPTPGDAKTAMNKLKAKLSVYDPLLKKRVKRRIGKPQLCRFYYCSHCKGWHLTSKEAKLTNKSIEKKFLDLVGKQSNLIRTQDQAGDWKADSLPFPETKTDTHDEMVQDQ